jgi:hypothetical protein
VVAAAGVLILVHIFLLLFRYGTAAASTWGDWLNCGAALIATIGCALAALGAGPFGRRVWRLVSISAFLGFVGQALYTDYYTTYTHRSTRSGRAIFLFISGQCRRCWRCF